MQNRIDEIILAKQRINDRANDMLKQAGIRQVTVQSITDELLLANIKLKKSEQGAPRTQGDIMAMFDTARGMVKQLASPPKDLTPEQTRVMTIVNLLREKSKLLVSQHEKPIELASAIINLSRFRYLFIEDNIEFISRQPSPEVAAEKLITLTVTHGISRLHAHGLIAKNTPVLEAFKANNYANLLKSYLSEQLARLRPGTQKHDLMQFIQSRLNNDTPASLEELHQHVQTLKDVTSKHQHFASIKRFGFFKRAAPTSRAALDKLFDEQNNLRPIQARG